MSAPFEPVHRRADTWGRRIAWSAFVIEIAISALIASSLQRGDALPHIPTSTARPATVTLESGFAVASAQAARWDADAALAAVTAYIYWPTSPVASTATAVPGDGWMVYVFAAGRRALSIYVNRNTGNVVTQSVAVWQEGLARRVDLAAYAVGSDIAVQIAEIVMGNAYRAGCPTHRYLTQVTASLGTTGDGAPGAQWVVTYADLRTLDRTDLLLRVDAVRGSVVASDDGSGPCAP